jgi:hypothetical protein
MFVRLHDLAAGEEAGRTRDSWSQKKRRGEEEREAPPRQLKI